MKVPIIRMVYMYIKWFRKASEGALIIRKLWFFKSLVVVYLHIDHYPTGKS